MKPPAPPAAPEEKPPAAPAEAKPAEKAPPAAPEEKPPAAPAEAKPAEKAPPAAAPKAKQEEDPFARGGDGLRTWTDNTGRYQVLARFVGRLPDGSVRLQRADGRYVRVAFERLGAAEQQVVREQLKLLAMD